ncbi:MAG: FG-GAP-like repeat-containing protein [Minisyncoccia bacterium]
MKKYFIIIVFVFMLTFSFAPTVSAERFFLPAVNYGVGDNPASIITGLFNNDAFLDLAVANNLSDNVSILLGAGDGTFGTAVNYGAGDNPTSIIAGLFNDDAFLDLAVTNNASDNVSILLGAGDGTFGTAVNYAVGDGPNTVITGLFNNDAFLDLAVTSWVGGLSILLGAGDGTFGAAVNYAVGTDPASVTTRDFNGDSFLDLVVVKENSFLNNVSVLLGVGDGTFANPANYRAGDNPSFVISGDFNGDTFFDLAVTSFYEKNVSILLGAGDGTFGTAVSYVISETGINGNPTSMITGLFNHDAYLDLAVVSDIGEDVVSILFGVGDGTFGAAVDYTMSGNPFGSAFSITTGLFNNDAYLDLAVTNKAFSDNVSILLGKLDLLYAGNFHEPYVNDGSLSGSRTASLFNDTFVNAGGTLSEGIHYALTNKPAGLTAVMTVDGAGETATLTFTGNATAHADIDDVNNLTITFLDGAFTNNATASNVNNYIDSNGTINFSPPGSFEGTIVLYGANGAGQNTETNLFTLDPNTGEVASTIGLMEYNINGMDFDPISGNLYGVTSNTDPDGGAAKSLFTIDTTTGIATLKCSIGFGFADIAFRSDGRLYARSGWNENSNSLYTINTEDCTATLVGQGQSDIGAGGGGGIAFDSEDNLYIFDEESSGFFKVNPDTGVIIESSAYAVDNGEVISSAKFDPNGILFATRNDFGSSTDLVTIDITTGVVTTVGGKDSALDYMTALAIFEEEAPPVDPTCSDGIQNQDETGIDIGGVCGAPEPEPTRRQSSGSYLPTHLNAGCKEGFLFSPATGRPCGINLASTALKFIFTKILKSGMVDSEAEELQKFLNTAGYGLLVVDGKFGPMTKAAIIKFQIANGLVGDGIVGPLTRAKLNNK